MLAQPQVGGIWDTESENLFSKTLWYKLRKIAKQSPAEGRQVIRGATGCRVPLDAKKRDTFVEDCRVFVRIKGLEPPRLSASDPKSDVATNYTISAGFECKGM